jgi:hypothetical protein
LFGISFIVTFWSHLHFVTVFFSFLFACPPFVVVHLATVFNMSGVASHRVFKNCEQTEGNIIMVLFIRVSNQTAIESQNTAAGGAAVAVTPLSLV